MPHVARLLRKAGHFCSPGKVRSNSAQPGFLVVALAFIWKGVDWRPIQRYTLKVAQRNAQYTAVLINFNDFDICTAVVAAFRGFPIWRVCQICMQCTHSAMIFPKVVCIKCFLDILPQKLEHRWTDKRCSQDHNFFFANMRQK